MFVLPTAGCKENNIVKPRGTSGVFYPILQQPDSFSWNSLSFSNEKGGDACLSVLEKSLR